MEVNVSAFKLASNLLYFDLNVNSDLAAGKHVLIIKGGAGNFCLQLKNLILEPYRTDVRVLLILLCHAQDDSVGRERQGQDALRPSDQRCKEQQAYLC